MSDTDTKQETATKETADQRKEREAAEQEAKDQVEKDTNDIETFWACYRGELLLRAQDRGTLDHQAALEAWEASKVEKADEKDDKASSKN